MPSGKPPTSGMSTGDEGIVPNSFPHRRDWRPGARPPVRETPEDVLLKPEPLFAPTTLDAVYGCLTWSGPAKTIGEMDAAVVAQAGVAMVRIV